jgi:superfamily II DNA or RNA helicase
MLIPKRRADTAYYSRWLWLPKTKVSVPTLKASLDLTLAKDKKLQLWRESAHHIGVPRGLISLDEVRCDVVDLTPTFPNIKIRSKIELDYLDPSKLTQRSAFADLVKARNGVLNLACGAGKTVIMLHFIAHRAKPALIISNQEEILEQWRDELTSYLELEQKPNIGWMGWIQGSPDTWEWKYPITFAMIRSLAKYRTHVNHHMMRHFGTVIWDECHHLSAPEFSKTADLFPGNRYGATATVERGDGTEVAYLWHIGKVIHENLDQDLFPKIIFARSPTHIRNIPAEDLSRITDSNGTIHIKKLLIYVGCLEQELNFVARHIQDALSAGRKILALSGSVQQLELLHERFPGSGLIIGRVKTAERRTALKSSRVCFGTADLAKEALNDRALDCLMILTEFVKDGMLQQAIGRIQRIMEGKKNPVVIVIRHRKIPKLESMASKMETYFRAQGFRMEEIL